MLLKVARMPSYARMRSGTRKVGNDKTLQITALVHCFPYIGFARALNAIRIVYAAPCVIAND